MMMNVGRLSFLLCRARRTFGALLVPSASASTSASASHEDDDGSDTLCNRLQKMLVHETPRARDEGGTCNIQRARVLLRMYAKCGRTDIAHHIFNGLGGHRDLLSWNAMISAYAHNGQVGLVFSLYQQMQMECVQPDSFTFPPILSVAGTSKNLSKGRFAHAHVVAVGLHSDITVENSLISLYGKCGILNTAYSLFHRMGKLDLVSWNTMIAAYGHNGHYQEALALFHNMDHQGLIPSRVTFLNIIETCANFGSLEIARDVHQCINNSGVELDIYVKNALVNMYGKCGSLEVARVIFDEMQQRNVVTWNTLIGVFSHCRLYEEALGLFRQMQAEGFSPTEASFLAVFDVCAKMGDIESSREMHELFIASGMESNIAIETALINMYGNCGSPDESRAVFNEMPQHDVISCTAMISVYARNGHGKDAFGIFQEMESRAIKPTEATFLAILDACSDPVNLQQGRVVHERITASSFASDPAIRNALISMYGKCGSPKDAQAVFEDTIHQKNIISWNAMIAAYTRNGCSEKALELFGEMGLNDLKPDRVTLLSIIDACAHLTSLESGKAVHNHITASGFELDETLKTSLVNMYGKCGSMTDAEAIFAETNRSDVISWTAMIVAYVRNGRSEKALQIFQEMDLNGVKPDRVTFLSIIEACSAMASLESARAIDECILASGLKSDLVVKMALLNMYGKCGSVKDARRIFDEVHPHNLFAWDAMIMTYVHNGDMKEALELFGQMGLEGIRPDTMTFVRILNACASLSSLEVGRNVHRQIVASGLESNRLLKNALVSMYGKCGSLFEARAVFEGLKNGYDSDDVILWNAMITVYIQNGQESEALELFRVMDLEGIKCDRTTLLLCINACASLAALEKGKVIHKYATKNGFEVDTLVKNALTNMYGKCGSLMEAWSMFNVVDGGQDIISWNTMIMVYAHNGHGEKAARLCGRMDMEGVTPNEITFLNILNGCSHGGMVEDGRAFFFLMSQEYGIEPLVEHYVCVVDLLGRAGHLGEAQELVSNMPVQPHSKVWSTILGACQIHSDTMRGSFAAKHVLELEPENASAYVSLSSISMRQWTGKSMEKRIEE